MKEKREESGLIFVFEAENTFVIEDETRDIQHLKRCEYVEMRKTPKGKPLLCFVEAKSSLPQYGNEQDFDVYVAGITQKFEDSVGLVNALCLNRFPSRYKRLNACFKAADMGCMEYSFVLVVNKPLEWLAQLSDVLKMRMKRLFRTWNINDMSLKVLSPEMAKELAFIQ